MFSCCDVRAVTFMYSYVRAVTFMYSYVRAVTFMYSYVRGGHVYVFVRTWRSRFAGHVISFCVFLFGAGLDSSRVSLPVSSGVGGGGCLHITVLVHFVNSAGLSRIYNNTSASGSASALRALRVVYTQL